MYKQKNYTGAINRYSEAINLDSANPTYYSNRAAAYLMLNQHKKAFQDCQQSLGLDPHNSKALLRGCKCCLALGLFDDADTMTKRLFMAEPNNQQLVSLKAELDDLKKTFDLFISKKNDGDYSHALFLIKKCITISPGSLEFKLNKAELLIRQKRLVEAKSWVESLISTSEADEPLDILYYRGVILYYMNHSDKAFEHFSHILQQNPDHLKTQKIFKLAKQIIRLKNEGNSFVKSRNFAEARNSYSQALSLDPLNDILNSILYCNRACALYNLEYYDLALRDCQSSLALDPNYVKAFVRRAKCYDALERYKDAIADWETICRLDGSSENQKGLKAAKIALERSKQVNFYKVLGVSKNASLDEIKKAYKQRARQHHPDRHADADEKEKAEQEKLFKTVGEAYAVLSDPHKKQQYDNGQYSQNGCGLGDKFDAAQMFAQMFSTGGGGVRFTF